MKIWFDDNNLPGPNCRHGWIVREKGSDAIPSERELIQLCKVGDITVLDLTATLIHKELGEKL